jgi:hypothetical protein
MLRFVTSAIDFIAGDAAYWLHEALAEPIDSIAIAKLETALEVLLRFESSKGSTGCVLTILKCFFDLRPEDLIAPNSALTAKEFAANLVRDRSRSSRHLVNAERTARP